MGSKKQEHLKPGEGDPGGGLEATQEGATEEAPPQGEADQPIKKGDAEVAAPGGPTRRPAEASTTAPAAVTEPTSTAGILDYEGFYARYEAPLLGKLVQGQDVPAGSRHTVRDSCAAVGCPYDEQMQALDRLLDAGEDI